MPHAQPGRSPLPTFHEPLRVTLLRTGLIAAALATAVTLSPLARVADTPGGLHGWLARFLFLGWFSFGGHWVELAYLNGLRPRLSHLANARLVAVRLAVWVVGGALLLPAAVLTHRLAAVGQLPDAAILARALALGGPLFVLIELVPHAVLQAFGRPSFWNLRG